jgi:hypothetical protein
MGVVYTHQNKRIHYTHLFNMKRKQIKHLGSYMYVFILAIIRPGGIRLDVRHVKQQRAGPFYIGMLYG